MALFRNLRKEARLDQDDFATLHVNVVMNVELENRAWELLQEEHPQLEAEIREAVSSILGPEFTGVQFLYNRSSIEIFVVIASTTFATYVGLSRYKNFVESMTLLSRQVRDIVSRFFRRRQHQPDAVMSGWIPGPSMMRLVFQGQLLVASQGSGFRPVLWYLILSHAALLLVVLWKVLQP